jgi:hypothetical protein
MTFRKPKQKELDRLDRISHILDSAIVIPGINVRMGIKPLVGFIPGFGDLVGMLLSSYIILESARLGAPKLAIARMVINVMLETFIGAVPILGDAFDIYYKANRRNVALLRRYV